MLSETYYLLRSKVDGRYLAANPHPEAKNNYLLLFREYADALSYLNKFAPELADRFAVESISSHQLKSLLQRWEFNGLGIVEDVLLPRVNFVTVS